LNVFLRRIVQVAEEFCFAEAASIFLFEQMKQGLIFQASTDIKNEEQMHYILAPKESIAGWVAVHSHPLNIEDVHQDRHFFSQVETKLDFPTSSHIAAPMIVMDKLVGVLEALN
jgi:signal transduction protein with GAF and PtsI domain